MTEVNIVEAVKAKLAEREAAKATITRVNKELAAMKADFRAAFAGKPKRKTSPKGSRLSEDIAAATRGGKSRRKGLPRKAADEAASRAAGEPTPTGA